MRRPDSDVLFVWGFLGFGRSVYLSGLLEALVLVLSPRTGDASATTGSLSSSAYTRVALT